MTEFDGFEQLAAKLQLLATHLDEAAKFIGPAVDAGVQTTALQIERSAREKVPVDTGNLRRKIDTQKVGEGEYLVGTNVPYAPDVEFGRGPVVADDGYLRFKVDGEVLFRKSVGPAEAQPFLRPALQEHKSDLVENIEEEIDTVLRAAFE
ncbi:HK97-gp10 family putative phage morphogenesis protein [Haloarcula onubensis]|uniref:HK97 gp10 family phage protein n=1 Tax=Haloarcula onubensis TaxID=2950539 RepID=A0ABU2FWL7_9EURY|nr:HK97-gp10 family putative phage morphogenesis protein [Halomicroarcula sp. S3CR25-11]MDS0284672.1 HK97 gp10 family phage protein [Halomicroarcula sp. S3CR25-11]